jgi:hypothetical protein
MEKAMKNLETQGNRVSGGNKFSKNPPLPPFLCVSKIFVAGRGCCWG